MLKENLGHDSNVKSKYASLKNHFNFLKKILGIFLSNYISFTFIHLIDLVKKKSKKCYKKCLNCKRIVKRFFVDLETEVSFRSGSSFVKYDFIDEFGNSL